MAPFPAMGILIRLVITAVSLWIAALVIDGIELTAESTTTKVGTLLAVAVIFGLVNAVLRRLGREKAEIERAVAGVSVLPDWFYARLVSAYGMRWRNASLTRSSHLLPLTSPSRPILPSGPRSWAEPSCRMAACAWVNLKARYLFLQVLRKAPGGCRILRPACPCDYSEISQASVLPISAPLRAARRPSLHLRVRK